MAPSASRCRGSASPWSTWSGISPSRWVWASSWGQRGAPGSPGISSEMVMLCDRKEEGS